MGTGSSGFFLEILGLSAEFSADILTAHHCCLCAGLRAEL